MALEVITDHTKLIAALRIGMIRDVIEKSTISLFNRVFCVDSPFRNVCVHLLALLLCKGIMIPGTLIHRIYCLGRSPVVTAFGSGNIHERKGQCNDGVVDSMRTLLLSENFNVPGSSEHNLLSLLTRAF